MKESWLVRLSVTKDQLNLINMAMYEVLDRRMDLLGKVLENPDIILSPDSLATDINVASSVIHLIEQSTMVKSGKTNLKLTDDQLRLLRGAVYGLQSRRSELLAKSAELYDFIGVPAFLVKDLECAKTIIKLLEKKVADWPF
jgi:hypothetical protein